MEEDDNKLNKNVKLNTLMIFSELTSIFNLYSKIINEGKEYFTDKEKNDFCKFLNNITINIMSIGQEVEKWDNELKRRKGL